MVEDTVRLSEHARKPVKGNKQVEHFTKGLNSWVTWISAITRPFMTPLLRTTHSAQVTVYKDFVKPYKNSFETGLTEALTAGEGLDNGSATGGQEWSRGHGPQRPCLACTACCLF